MVILIYYYFEKNVPYSLSRKTMVVDYDYDSFDHSSKLKHFHVNRVDLCYLI